MLSISVTSIVIDLAAITVTADSVVASINVVVSIHIVTSFCSEAPDHVFVSNIIVIVVVVAFSDCCLCHRHCHHHCRHHCSRHHCSRRHCRRCCRRSCVFVFCLLSY